MALKTMKPKENKKSKPAPSPCDPKRVKQAISILKQLNEKFNEKREKKSLLDDDSENPIILQLTMKKIPPLSMQKFIKVRLPTSILTDKNEVCLITGDLDKHNTKAEVEPDVLHFKELLKKENISQVNEVITLRQLRKEYKPFEARRQLCGAYDTFLCDKRIAGVLPHALGKCFFRKRKLPIQINMQTPKLKEQIENALSSTVFHITCRGNSCASEVGNLSMNDEDILSNVLSSINVLKEELPGQWDNVLGIYVKTPKSKAIPIHMSNDDPNDFNFSKKRSRTKAVTAELSTLPNVDVKVFRDGRVVVKKKEESDDENADNVELKGKNKDDCNSAESDSQAVNSDTDAEKKSDKKSKKRKSNEGIKNKNTVAEIEENSEGEKPGVKSKKHKSSLKLNEETEVIQENFKGEELGMKIKKRQSSMGFHGEIIETGIEDEKLGIFKTEESNKKSKKRKVFLGLNSETTDNASSEVEINEEDNGKSESTKPGKKSKKCKSKVRDKEENIEEVLVKNSKNVKQERKNKSQKSDLALKEDSTEVKKENSKRLSKKFKKQI